MFGWVCVFVFHKQVNKRHCLKGFALRGIGQSQLYILSLNESSNLRFILLFYLQTLMWHLPCPGLSSEHFANVLRKSAHETLCVGHFLLQVDVKEAALGHVAGAPSPRS